MCSYNTYQVFPLINISAYVHTAVGTAVDVGHQCLGLARMNLSWFSVWWAETRKGYSMQFNAQIYLPCTCLYRGSSSTRARFQPQRPSGQAVGTGFAPPRPPPRCSASFLSRVAFGNPPVRRFPSIFANLGFRVRQN